MNLQRLDFPFKIYILGSYFPSSPTVSTQTGTVSTQFSLGKYRRKATDSHTTYSTY
jgi:hypothetical protein